jgi:hypothetical protein
VPGPPNQAKLQLIFSKFDQNLNLIPLPPPQCEKNCNPGSAPAQRDPARLGAGVGGGR